MKEFKANGVPHAGPQILVVNVGGGSAEHARQLAREIRRRIGQDRPDGVDGAIEGSKPEDLDAREVEEGGTS